MLSFYLSVSRRCTNVPKTIFRIFTLYIFVFEKRDVLFKMTKSFFYIKNQINNLVNATYDFRFGLLSHDNINRQRAIFTFFVNH